MKIIIILRDWAKDKVQKSLAEALNRFEKPEEERKPFLLENYLHVSSTPTLDQMPGY